MNKPKDCSSPSGSHSPRLCLQQEDLNFSEEENIPSVEQCLGSQKGCEMVPPDGGWGFLIIVGGFFTMVCCYFPVFGFSILFHPTLIWKVSSSKIAWIMSVRLFGNVVVIFVGPLCQEFGWRNVAIVVGILNFLSIFLSVFISNPDFLFFSFGLLGGISGGVGINLTYIVISRYFRKRRGFAVAIAALGICVAYFLSPLTANYLMEIYGQRGTCLIFGALLLNQCVAGALFQPVERHLIPVNSSVYKSKDNQNEEKLLNIKPTDEINSLSIQKSKRVSPVSYTLKSSHEEPTIKLKKKFPTANDQDDDTHHSKSFYSIFKRIIVSTHESILTLKFMRVKIISLGTSCLLLGNIIFQMWIPFVISNSGYSLELSAWCVSISSVTNGTGQILMSILSDRKWFNIKYGYIFSIFLIGLSIIAFSIVEEWKLFIVCVCFWGFGVGVSLTLQPVVIMTMVGVQIFPKVIGISCVLNVIFILTVVPIIGVIHDATSSYTYALSFLGGSVLTGVVAWLFMPLAIKYDKENIFEKAFESDNENF